VVVLAALELEQLQIHLAHIQLPLERGVLVERLDQIMAHKAVILYLVLLLL
jgi:hypothetical protein